MNNARFRHRSPQMLVNVLSSELNLIKLKQMFEMIPHPLLFPSLRTQLCFVMSHAPQNEVQPSALEISRAA